MASTRADAEDIVRRRASRLFREARFAFLPAVRRELPGSEWYVVGGAVRDMLGGRTPQDVDFVVRGASFDALASVLGRFGSVNFVGKAFGVAKFMPESGGSVDIAWPRTEHAGMSGAYRDVVVRTDAKLAIEHDLARRDFTVNAIAWNVATGALVDPSGGLRDLRGGIVRAVGEPSRRFREDYSRMLRALRFACQLGFDIEKRTWEALVGLMPNVHRERLVETPAGPRKERVVPYETIAKELLKALDADATRAINLFEASGALFALVPELAPLASCAQSPDVHGEGDAWTHTKLAVAALGSRGFSRFFGGGARADVETVVATILHDVAKPLTAGRKGERITFYGHEEKGAHIAEQVVSRLKLSSAAGFDVNAERVGWLVKHHLFPGLVDLLAVKKTTLAKYFLDDRPRGKKLLHLAFADGTASRPRGRKGDVRNVAALMKELASLEAKQPPAASRTVASGIDVMRETGIAPGPDVGRILEDLHEAQLRGEIWTHEDAVRFLRHRHAGHRAPPEKKKAR